MFSAGRASDHRPVCGGVRIGHRAGRGHPVRPFRRPQRRARFRSLREENVAGQTSRAGRRHPL
eukprot:8880858-Lingulodinium_polyedra.AAC.1